MIGYINKFFDLINDGYDFIGIKEWYIITNDDHNLYKIKYTIII